MAHVHPTALVDPGARIAPDASVGPFSIIGPEVELGAGVAVDAHVVIAGRTSVGAGTRIAPFASLGQPGQIYKSTGEVGRLEIGARCDIREHVTINCGSPRERMLTRIGDDCMFMVASHVAHDCTVGDKVIFANNATLGGHVTVGEQTFIGGLAAIHQFVRIGEHAMIGGVTGVRGDVIPFGLVEGARARLLGLNLVGLKRRGFSREQIQTLRRLFDDLFTAEGSFADRKRAAREAYAEPLAVRILDFIEGGKRELCLPQLATGLD